jgi:transposase
MSPSPAANGDAAEVSASVHDGAAVFLRLARQRDVADDQSCAADGGARGRGQRDQRGPGVIDSQSVKTTEAGGPRGYAAEKMIKGRNLTDTIGLPVGMIVHPANMQDRDGAPDLLESIRSSFPRLRPVFADGGYAGDKLRSALENLGEWTIDRQTVGCGVGGEMNARLCGAEKAARVRCA